MILKKRESNIPQAARCTDISVPQEVQSPSASWDLYSEYSWIWQTVRNPGSQEEHPLSGIADEPFPLKRYRVIAIEKPSLSLSSFKFIFPAYLWHVDPASLQYRY